MALVGGLFLYSICSNGPPTLRHDWNWSTSHESFVAGLVGAVSPWKTENFGYPSPYPTDWLIALPTSLFGLLFGSNLTLWLFVAFVGVVMASGAWRLARAFHGDGSSCALAASFALLNPWTYNEIVAGHTYLIVAVGALMGLGAELLRGTPRKPATTLWVALVVPQVQIALIAAMVIAAHAARKRAWFPMVSFLVLWAPTILAVTLERHQLLKIPYNLAWEQAQSLHLADAIVLSGYFAHYSAAAGALFRIGTAATAAIAGIGYWTARGARVVHVIAVAAALALLYALGMNGPFPHLFALLVQEVPESGVFRELYDLLAVVLIAYAAGASVAARRWPILRLSWAVALLVLAIAWLCKPPAGYFVDGRTLPVVHIQAHPNTRFALMPAFQPLKYLGKGSGLDHDVYTRTGNAQPLNAALSTYPADAALAAFDVAGTTRFLGALSVTRVVMRSNYESNSSALRLQQAMGAAQHSARSSQVVAAIPLLSYVPGRPPIVSIGDNLWRSGIFFGDTRPKELRVPAADGKFIRASDGWVDVRLAFQSEPRFAQGIGGVITSSLKPLAVPRLARYALVLARGTLRSTDGRTIATGSTGYAWHALRNTAALRCYGECAVAAFAYSVPPSVPNGPKVHWKGLSMTQPVPWVAWTVMPPKTGGTLRLNDRYDRNWLAFAGGRLLQHFPLDQVANGWHIPVRSASRFVLLVEGAAFAEVLAMLVGFGFILVVFVAFRKEAGTAESGNA